MTGRSIPSTSLTARLWLLIACLAGGVATEAVVPRQPPVNAVTLRDRRAITFEAAVTIEAMQRSNDVVVRSLRVQVASLRKEIASGRGNVAALREQAGALQDEIVSRLAESDARYAAERDKFVQAISALFDSNDEQILVLLHRYAEGDAAALSELQRALRIANVPPVQLLLNQRAFAALLLDAARKKQVEERKAIAALEEALDEHPGDIVVMEQLYNLYVFSAPERARTLAGRMHASWASYGDPGALARSLQSLAMTSLRSGDKGQALEHAEKSVAYARIAAAQTFNDWKAEHPGATEPAWMIENHNREQLAVTLRTLATIQRARGELRSAALAADESAANRRLYIDTLIAAKRDVGSTPYNYAAAASSDAGAIYADAGDWTAAMSAYRITINLAEAGAREFVREEKPKRTPGKPFWALTPYAGAAINAGQLDVAEKALAAAWEGLKATGPAPSTIAGEGLYWLQVGKLRHARGRAAEAKAAWESAEAALSQAVSLERENEQWADALKETGSLLAQ